MVNAALDRPDETVRNVLYPVVPGGEKTLRALAKELMAAERAVAERVRYQLRGSYSQADGHDGASLRELAGLNDKDPYLVRELLPAALTETGTPVPATDVDATDHASATSPNVTWLGASTTAPQPSTFLSASSTG
jgi:hypothetical protein